MRTIESARQAEQNLLHRQSRSRPVYTGAGFSGEFAETDALERDIREALEEESGPSLPRISLKDAGVDSDYWNR